MASIHKQKRDGCWYGQFRLNGKQKWVRLGFDRALAVKWRKEVNSKQQHNDPILSALAQDCKLSDYIKAFREHLETDGLSGSTQESYACVIRCIETLAEKYGIKRMSQFTLRHLEEIKQERSKTMRDVSLNTFLTWLKSFFAFGVRTNRIGADPCNGLTKVKTVPKPREIFTWGEVRAVAEALPAWLKAPWWTLLYSGMRRGELEALTWDDVDFERGLIHVRPKQGFTPKSRKSRAIPMHPEVRRILEALPRREERVFLTPQGKEIHSLQRLFRPTLNRLGLGHKTTHCLRHTYASNLVMQGADIASVKELLGHASLVTTQVYAHPDKQHLRDAVNRLTYEPKVLGNCLAETSQPLSRLAK